MESFPKCYLGWFTFVNTGHALLSNQATVKLRVTKPYRQYETVTADKIFDKNTPLNIGSM